jgi:hypothetical protein
MKRRVLSRPGVNSPLVRNSWSSHVEVLLAELQTSAVPILSLASNRKEKCLAVKRKGEDGKDVDSEGLFFLFLGVDLPVGAVMRICPRVPSSKIADDKPLVTQMIEKLPANACTNLYSTYLVIQN